VPEHARRRAPPAARHALWVDIPRGLGKQDRPKACSRRSRFCRHESPLRSTASCQLATVFKKTGVVVFFEFPREVRVLDAAVATRARTRTLTNTHTTPMVLPVALGGAILAPGARRAPPPARGERARASGRTSAAKAEARPRARAVARRRRARRAPRPPPVVRHQPNPRRRDATSSFFLQHPNGSCDWFAYDFRSRFFVFLYAFLLSSRASNRDATLTSTRATLSCPSHTPHDTVRAHG